MTSTQTSRIGKRDFMCVCSEDSKAQAEACYERVCEEFGCEPGDLLSSVVYALEWGLPENYRAHIAGIGCDQWCGVSVEVFHAAADPKARYEEIGGAYVQCDVVEHGIARAWELAREVCTEHGAEDSDAS